PASQGISDREQALPPQWVLSIQNRLSKLELYKLLRKLSLDMMRSDAPKPAFSQVSGLKRVSPLEFEKNLRDIISLAHSEQIEPILLAPPIASLKNYFPGVTHAPFHQLHAEYQGLIRQVAERTETKLLDLQEAFDLRHDLFDSPRDDPVHFNAAGHLLVAEAIATAMRGSGVAEALH
ncbi:MAG: SGNH/GDSL hydrolase family protein, partial [Candidatus Zixiibacteriota bacterium]